LEFKQTPLNLLVYLDELNAAPPEFNAAPLDAPREKPDGKGRGVVSWDVTRTQGTIVIKGPAARTRLW
jgi:hypothetical protein